MKKMDFPTQELRNWFATQARAIKRLEKDDLDLQRAGQWPDSIKALALLGLLAGALFASNWLLIGSLGEQIEAARTEQQELFERYRLRSFQAANLEEHREQMRTIEASFDELLTRLPAAREVPRLLEDIHGQASSQGLDIQALTLGNDQRKDFYSELPFEIRVHGDYHRLASFMAGVSSLNRIITLHDFALTPLEAGQPTRLNLVLQARTYRQDEQAPARGRR